MCHRDTGRTGGGRAQCKSTEFLTLDITQSVLFCLGTWIKKVYNCHDEFVTQEGRETERGGVCSLRVRVRGRRVGRGYCVYVD